MRNKLLFTAAMVCMEMTPFGRVYAPAQAADEVGQDGAYGLYGVSDGVVNAAYDSNGDLAGEQKATGVAAGSGGTDNFVKAGQGQSRLVDPAGERGDPAGTDTLNIASQKTDTLNTVPGGSQQVQLGRSILQVTNSGADTAFSGSIVGTAETLPDGSGHDVPIVSQSGGLDVDARQGLENHDGSAGSAPLTNTLTLTGQNRYDGYTLVRGNGMLVLRDGGSIASRGVTEVGVGSDDTASLVVDKGGKLSLDGSSAGASPNATVGSLVVGNNDWSLKSTPVARQAVEGSNASNRLIVQNGGQVDARSVFVANRTDASYDAYANEGIIYVTGGGSELHAGDGGLTINSGKGTVLVDKGATVRSDGAISIGDGQGLHVAASNAASPVPSSQGVDGTLIVGKRGTLVAGDVQSAVMNTTDLSTPGKAAQANFWNYAHPIDGITQNMGQDSNPDSFVYSNRQSGLNLLGGTLANRTNADGTAQAVLHTNMDIGLSGMATLQATDTKAVAVDPLASRGSSTAGITIAGNIGDYGNPNKQPSSSGGLDVRGGADGQKGTVALLGNNSYTGRTMVDANGTLQLGGVMGTNSSGEESAYTQRLRERLIANGKTEIGLGQLEPLLNKAQKALDVVPAGQTLTLRQQVIAFGNKQLAQRNLPAMTPAEESDYVNRFVFSQRDVSAALNDIKVQNQSWAKSDTLTSYLLNDPKYGTATNLNAGTIDSKSAIQLGSSGTTGTLNLAWGLHDGYVSANGLTTDQNSRVIANDISGTGQIERDVRDGNDADSAKGSTALNDVNSVTHLTGTVNLGRGADSSDTALLVRKGILSVDNGGAVSISGNRNIVVGSDQGSANNQLQVENNGSITSDGNLVIAAGSGSQGNVVIGNYDAQSAATGARLDLVGTGQNGTITVGQNGAGYLSVQKGGEVSANRVIVGGQANASTLNVGFANAAGVSKTGGILNIGQGGLAVGEDKTDATQYAAGVTAGGVINSLGQVSVKKDGFLQVGNGISNDWTEGNDAERRQKQGTLVAGDNAVGYGIVSDSTQKNAQSTSNNGFSLFGNGVIQNRDHADLHIDSVIYVEDTASGHHGTFDTNGQNAYAMKQLIGAGGLTKDGQGTLYLEASDNSYAGRTEVKDGTLAVAAPTTGTMQKDASGNDIGYNSSIAKSSGVQVDSGATLTGFTSTDTTRDSNGNYANYGAAAATTAEAGGTVEANWNNSYGTLNIGAYRGSDYSGTTPTLTMNDGSTLSVGASSAAFASTDDRQKKIDLSAGATGYDRAAGAGRNDTRQLNRVYDRLSSGVVNVNGGADLKSATLNVQLNGNARVYDGDGFRILTTTGQVKANHDNALTGGLTTLPYVSPYLVFENQAVDVVMERNAAGFGAPAVTRNERETGHGLDGLSSGSALARAMTGMTSAGEARRALNNVSGEIHASARSALIQDSYLLEQAVLDRLANSGCDGDSPVSAHGRYDLHTRRKDSRCYSDHAVLWGQAYGSMGHNAGDGNASTLHHQTTGFIMGVDTPLDDRWRVGGMVAYGRSMFNSGGASNSSGNSNNISIGTYAGSHWGRLNLRLGGFYSWNLMNMRRQVQVADFGGRQTSHYRNGTARVFGELGYKMNFHKVQFEPFAGLSYVNQYGGGFREHGVAALYSKGQDDGVLFSSFGFRAARNFRIGDMWLRAHAMGAYRHAFGGIVSSRQQNLIGSTNDMSIGGVPLSRDSAVVKTGVTAKLSDRIDLDLSYIGQYGNQSIESGATGSVHITF